MDVLLERGLAGKTKAQMDSRGEMYRVYNFLGANKKIFGS